MRWIIQDWNGNRLFPSKSFDTMEDGWLFVQDNCPEEDWEDIFVEQSDVLTQGEIP